MEKENKEKMDEIVQEISTKESGEENMEQKHDEASSATSDARESIQAEALKEDKARRNRNGIIVACIIASVAVIAFGFIGAIKLIHTQPSGAVSPGGQSQLHKGDMTVDVLEEYAQTSDTEAEKADGYVFIEYYSSFDANVDERNVGEDLSEEEQVKEYAEEFIGTVDSLESVSELEKTSFKGAEREIDAYRCNAKFNLENGEKWNYAIYLIPYDGGIYSISIGGLGDADPHEEEWISHVRIKGYQTQEEIKASAEEEKRAEEERNGVVRITSKEEQPAIYESNEVKVSISSIGYSEAINSDDYQIDFFIENNTNGDISVDIENAVINGYQIDTSSLWKDIHAGNKGATYSDIDRESIEQFGISSWDEVSFTVSIRGDDLNEITVPVIIERSCWE